MYTPYTICASIHSIQHVLSLKYVLSYSTYLKIHRDIHAYNTYIGLTSIRIMTRFRFCSLTRANKEGRRGAYFLNGPGESPILLCSIGVLYTQSSFNASLSSLVSEWTWITHQELLICTMSNMLLLLLLLHWSSGWCAWMCWMGG